MIFYYTGTGNSKYIAEIIGEELGEEISNIATYIRDKKELIVSGERVVVVSPVYFWGIPHSVLEFSKLLGKQNCKYKALVLDCGGSTGNAQQLFEKNCKLDAIFGLIATDNYCPMFKVKPNTDVNVISALDRMVTDAKNIANQIKAVAQGDYNNVKGGLASLYTMAMYPLYKLSGRKTSFRVSDDCNGCGLCANSCNTGVIEIKNNKPEWTSKKCDMCLMCLSRCPKNAIYIGKSKANGRYINPRVKF